MFALSGHIKATGLKQSNALLMVEDTRCLIMVADTGCRL